VLLVYAPRRVNCLLCGVKVERVPWTEEKSQLTTAYQWFLARWAKRLSWPLLPLAPLSLGTTAGSDLKRAAEKRG